MYQRNRSVLGYSWDGFTVKKYLKKGNDVEVRGQGALAIDGARIGEVEQGQLGKQLEQEG